jgi:hypothetical protein
MSGDNGAENAPAQERSRKPEPPYCWQNKEALRKIREHLDGDSLLPYALSVYCALTENASDKGEEKFTTLQSHLARLAGNVSTRTVQRVLPVLREIAVVDYMTPKLRGPITFQLLSVGTYCPIVATNSHNVATNEKTAFQTDNRSNNEGTKKEQRKKQPQEVTSDFIAQQQSLFQNVNVEQEYAKAKAWALTNGRKCNRRFFENWLARAKPDPAVGKKEER